jgi:hypothetical protein
MSYKIIFSEDGITIIDKGGTEIYWNKEEWEENSNVVFSIANAIKLVSEGKEFKKILMLQPLSRVKLCKKGKQVFAII